MKRRSLLGSLLGLPAGVALGKAAPDDAEDASLRIETKIAGMQTQRITVSGTWTPVEPSTRINDLYLAGNDAGTYRWMRAR